LVSNPCRLFNVKSRPDMSHQPFLVVDCLPDDGRLSTMKTTGLLQGTLDMLILRTLLFGPAHGHQIAKHIQSATDDILRLEHGSLYPALHRLERPGWVAAK